MQIYIVDLVSLLVTFKEIDYCSYVCFVNLEQDLPIDQLINFDLKLIKYISKPKPISAFAKKY